jgi:crotonobetainyl-CoA:carnitine CoA-transferase CaiB-like acyl-CoA transferase
MIFETVDSAGRKLKLVGNPIHWPDRPESIAAAPPALGEHSAEVLHDWLGYDTARIAELRREGALE